MERTVVLTVSNTEKERIDTYLASELPDTSRSQIKSLLEKNCISLNGSKINKAGIKIKAGDKIDITFPDLKEPRVQAEDIPLNIVYEDEYIAVINKPQGMVTHPAPGNYSGTLVNAIMHNIKNLSGINGELRPGIVHRLDKDTSGLIVIAKNDAAHESVSAQIGNREVTKEYIALLHGNLKDDNGTVVTNIGRHPVDRKKMAVTKNGRQAITHYEVLKRYGKFTLVKFKIDTGRTHQIRVHAKHLGHAIVGDVLYSHINDNFKLRGQLLHSAHIVFKHPIDNRTIDLSAPLPQYFTDVLLKLETEI